MITAGSIRSELALVESVIGNGGRTPKPQTRVVEARNTALHYGYYVNKDERGEFNADVRDPDGKTVYEIQSDEETGEIPEVVDGWMKNGADLGGLKEYLVHLGLIPRGADVMDSDRFEDMAQEESRRAPAASRRLAEGKGKGAQAAVEKAAQAVSKAAMDATKAEDPNIGTALQMISGALLRLSKGDVRGTADALESAMSWVQKMPSGQAAAAKPAAPAPAAPADDSEPTDDEIAEAFGLREDRRHIRTAKALVEGKKKVVAEARSAGEFMALARAVWQNAQELYHASTVIKSEMDNWNGMDGMADFDAVQKKIYAAASKCLDTAVKATKDADQLVGAVKKTLGESREPVTERFGFGGVELPMSNQFVQSIGKVCKDAGDFLEKAGMDFDKQGQEDFSDLASILGIGLKDISDHNFKQAATAFKTVGELCADVYKNFGESRERPAAAAVTEAAVPAITPAMQNAVTDTNNRPDLSRAFRRYKNFRQSGGGGPVAAIKAVVAKDKLSPEDEATLVLKLVNGKQDAQKLYALYFQNPSKFDLKYG